MPSRRILLRGDVAIAITPKAFDTLVALVEWRDRVVSREELLSHLWPGVAVEEANLTQQVFLLRKALDESGRASNTSQPFRDGAIDSSRT